MMRETVRKKQPLDVSGPHTPTCWMSSWLVTPAFHCLSGAISEKHL